MKNLEKYNNIFMNIFDVSEEELNGNFRFDSIDEWDSLTHMDLISQLEDEFDVMFETNDILSYQSYENGKKILEKYGKSFKD